MTLRTKKRMHYPCRVCEKKFERFGGETLCPLCFDVRTHLFRIELNKRRKNGSKI
jgi:hypothetical protein